MLLYLFETLLGVGFLLLADFSFNDLLAVKCLFTLHLLALVHNFLLGHMHIFNLTVECHVIKRLFKALNVDLE